MGPSHHLRFLPQYRRNLTRFELVFLTLILAVAATARPPYLAMSLLLFLPAANTPNPRSRDLLGPSSAFVMVLAVAALWRYLVLPLGLDPSDLADPARQTAFLAAHPILATRAILHGTFAAALDLHRGLYVIGWNDLLPPAMATILLALSLAVILLVAPCKPILLTRAARVLLALSLAAPLLGISLAEYIIWTPPGTPTVYGIQPRYWLPILPTASLLLPTLRSSNVTRELSRISPILTCLLLIAVAILAASTLTLPSFAAAAFYRQNIATVLRLNLH